MHRIPTAQGLSPIGKSPSCDGPDRTRPSRSCAPTPRTGRWPRVSACSAPPPFQLHCATNALKCPETLFFRIKRGEF